MKIASHNTTVTAADDHRSRLLAFLLAVVLLPAAFAADSEDAQIKNLHWLGPINGHTNILRCASPMMDIAQKVKDGQPTGEDLKLARERMQHLRDLGIRTVISFQHQDPGTNVERRAVTLEKAAAQEVGLNYLAFPMSNKGTNSFEDMSDETVIKLLDPISEEIMKLAQTGGVAFHCKSGKDRTGIMTGYLRIKYQHWTADAAIAEMRRGGHPWEKFAKPGASNSWHELHLCAIAKVLTEPAVSTNLRPDRRHSHHNQDSPDAAGDDRQHRPDPVCDQTGFKPTQRIGSPDNKQ
jgi:protein-tyrosine phosphatase